MIRLRRRFAALGLAVAAIATVWILTNREQSSEESAATEDARTVKGLRPLPSLPVPAAPVVANAPEPIAARVQPLMQTWRLAIINKNPDDVESLDRTFASNREAFIPALLVSAETDPEERVRSFSTRVLGKLRPPESVAVVRKLLSDRSEYVRFNAAWALGELADHDAVPRLRALEKKDPSAIVRQSAGESLRKLEGG